MVKNIQQHQSEIDRNDEMVLSIGPLARHSLRAQAFVLIKTAIITGTLRHGEIYSVKFFADRFGVSRTPVREALLDLAGQGFVEALPNRGFQITTISDKDQDDIAAVRSMLEVPAIGIVARLIGDAELTEARRLCRATVDMARQGNLPEFLEADRVFHIYLVSQCNNGQLTRIITELRDRMHLHGMPYLAETGALTISGEEHSELIDALALRDEMRAQDVMRSHLAHLRSDWAGR
jgi:DNA-binding GntR family transcriptional regulator